MSWELYHRFGGEDKDPFGEYRNVSGSPVVSASLTDQSYDDDYVFRYPPAGVYRFTFTGAATLSMELREDYSSDDPFVESGSISVTCDGSTQNFNVLYGWKVVLSATAQEGDIFEIGSGAHWNSGTEEWTKPMRLGRSLRGYAKSSTHMRAKNISGESLTGCKVYALPFVWDGVNPLDSWSVFLSLRLDPEVFPRIQSDVTKPVTFDNCSWFEGNYYVDVLLSGSIAYLSSSSYENVIAAEQVNIAWGEPYRFALLPESRGVRVIFDDDTVEDSADGDIVLSSGHRLIQLSEDDSSWSSGHQGIDLTSSGQTTGTVLNNDTVDWYFKAKPPSGVDSGYYGFILLVVGTDGSDDAVWNEIAGSIEVAGVGTPLVFRTTAVSSSVMSTLSGLGVSVS